MYLREKSMDFIILTFQELLNSQKNEILLRSYDSLFTLWIASVYGKNDLHQYISLF